jgi:hypothetical protein
MHGCQDAPLASEALVQAELEVADIARRYGQQLCGSYQLSIEQHQVLEALTLCRTAALGGHMDVCQTCGHQRPLVQLLPQSALSQMPVQLAASMAREKITAYFTYPSLPRGVYLTLSASPAGVG